MDITLDRNAVGRIRGIAEESIAEGDTESLREEIFEAFTEEQVEALERRVPTADFYEFLSDVMDEWSQDDIDELFELLEAHFGDSGIELKFLAPRGDDDDDSDEEEVLTPDEDML